MMGTIASLSIAWMPFVNPMTLPVGARLWSFLPLAFAVAIVYRATRAVTVKDVLRGVSITFLNIVLGMAAIALAAYGAHQLVLRLWTPG